MGGEGEEEQRRDKGCDRAQDVQTEKKDKEQDKGIKK